MFYRATLSCEVLQNTLVASIITSEHGDESCNCLGVESARALTEPTLMRSLLMQRNVKRTVEHASMISATFLRYCLECPWQAPCSIPDTGGRTRECKIGPKAIM